MNMSLSKSLVSISRRYMSGRTPSIKFVGKRTPGIINITLFSYFLRILGKSTY